MVKRLVRGILSFRLYNNKDYSYHYTFYKNKKIYYIYDKKKNVIAKIEIDLDKMEQFVKLRDNTAIG